MDEIYMLDFMKKNIMIPNWLFIIAILFIIFIIYFLTTKATGQKFNSVINLISLATNIFLLVVTANLYIYQNSILKSENTPYPYISSVSGHMITEDELASTAIDTNTKSDPAIAWYYYGKQEAKYLGEEIEKMGKELIETNPEDRKLINEIKNNEGTICFSKLNDENCILFINENIRSSFVLEYCSAIIKLKNYGSTFYNIQLESIKVTFNEENGNREIILSSGNTKQNNIPLIVESNNEISLIYCQVTHNLINAQCITSETIREEIGDSYDLLTKRIPDNAFNYDKIEIIISCENFIGEKFRYKLMFEKQGFYYISRTEILDK